MAQHLIRVDISRMPELARLADEVRATNTPRLLRRDDTDVAVLISPEQWARYQERVKAAFFQAIDALQERNRAADPDEVERDVAEAIKGVRRKLHERRQQAGRGA